MSDYQFNVSCVQYTIPLSDAFDVTMLECVNDAFYYCNGKGVDDLLESITGVHSIDYNGHFGNNLYLTIDEEYNNESTRQAIIAVLKHCRDHYEPASETLPERVLIASHVGDSDKDGAIESFVDNLSGELMWIEGNDFDFSPCGAPISISMCVESDETDEGQVWKFYWLKS